MSDVHLFRGVARLFQARATYRIGQGNIDGAIDDKLALHRLGRLIPPGGAMVQYLVGVSVEALAREIPIGTNPKHPLTEQQIRRILDGLDALPPRASIRDAIEWERYCGLSIVQSLMLGEVGFDGIAPKTISAIPTSFNWNIIFRRLNETYDAMLVPPPREKYSAIEEEIMTEYSTKWKVFVRALIPGSVERVMGNMFIALLCPAVDAFEESKHRSECAENMQRLALAILLYQLEHDEMPGENWVVQIEPYLAGTPAAGAEVPAKYFSCPSNPAPEGETTYALVQYPREPGTVSPESVDTVAVSRDVLMLLELDAPVPFAEAVITVDAVRELVSRNNPHPGGMNVANRSGAVLFLSTNVEAAELLRMLGREEE